MEESRGHGTEGVVEAVDPSRLDLGSCMLCVTDSHGTFKSVNLSWTENLGWTSEELTSRPFLDFVHPDDRDRTIEQMEKLSASRYFLRDFENRYRRKDGAWRTLSWTTWSDGDTWLGFAIDVTDIRRREHWLRDSLEAGRLIACAQPIFDLSGAGPVQWELLARIEENGELISPAEFLPIAEQSGQVQTIDERMLEMALELAGRGEEVAVNLSAQSFGADRFMDRLIDLIVEAPPEAASRLVLELTETAEMSDGLRARMLTKRICALGVRLSLDDFGTGYGSLSYLRDLPVTYVKIDRSFVSEATTSAANRAMITCVIGMAHSLGQTTIAEGVEDADTLQMLEGWGVDRAQGFMLGRPHPLGRDSGGLTVPSLTHAL